MRNMSRIISSVVSVCLVLAICFATTTTQPQLSVGTGSMTLAKDAQEAMKNLRDINKFSWNAVPMLGILLYCIGNEIEQGHPENLLASLALIGVDIFVEILNSVVMWVTGYYTGVAAPWWATPDHNSSLILMVGVNFEILVNFALAGLFCVKALPARRTITLFNIEFGTRTLFVLFCSTVHFIVEVYLNRVGALTWDIWYWNAQYPYLPFLIGYLPFYAIAIHVKECSTMIERVRVCMGIWTIDAVCIGVCGFYYGLL